MNRDTLYLRLSLLWLVMLLAGMGYVLFSVGAGWP
jgi:hypothetical protein